MKKGNKTSFIYSSVDVELSTPVQPLNIDLSLSNYEKIRNYIFSELRITETQKRIKNKILCIDNDEIDLLFYQSKYIREGDIEDSIDSLLSDVGDNKNYYNGMDKEVSEDGNKELVISNIEGELESEVSEDGNKEVVISNIEDELDKEVSVGGNKAEDSYNDNIILNNGLTSVRGVDDSVSSDTLDEDDFPVQNEVNLDYIEDEAELSGSGSSDSIVNEKEIFEDLKRSKFISTKKIKDDYFDRLSKYGEEMEVLDTEKLNKLKEKYGSKKMDFKYKKIFSKREFKDEEEEGVDASSSEDGFLYSAISELESEMSHEKACDIEETEFAKSLDENKFLEKSLVFSNKQDVLEEMVKDKGKKNNYAFQRTKK